METTRQAVLWRGGGARGRAPHIACTLLCVALLALLVPALARAQPGEWNVEAPSTIRFGRPARFTVTASGVSEPTVLLHHRGKGASRYTTLRLRALDGGRFSGEVKEEATRTTELRYYIEAHGRDGGFSYRLGSASQPLAIPVLEPGDDEEDAASSVALQAAATIGGVALVVLLAWRVDRRRRHALLEQLFWTELLAPLARVSRQEAMERASHLAETTLDHPVRGAIRLTRDEILDRLRSVRTLHVKQIEEQASRRSGSELDSGLRPAPPAAGPDARPDAQLSSLAVRVGSLCAIGYLLASAQEEMGEGNSKLVGELLQPLARAREAIKRIQEHLKEGRREEAAALLGGVGEKLDPIHRRINALDQAQGLDEFVRAIERGKAVTADLLCRLVEYRALHASRSVESGLKLVAAVRALAARDATEDHTPEGIRQSLVRRRLLTSTRREHVPEDMVQRATRLRAEIERARPSRTAELDVSRAQVEDWIEQLGKLVYTLDGLSHAVALRVALELKATWIERQVLGSFDVVAENLDDVVQVGSQTMEFVISQSDDAVAADYVELLLAELVAAVNESACAERGFYLEPIELEAARGEIGDARWASLVLRAAACRTAIDRLAAAHARKYQPAGQEPPALPMSLALELVRLATHIETDIREQNELDLVKGLAERLASSGRLLSRLSRARLGLAVLGGFSATGFREETLAGVAAGEAEDELEDEPQLLEVS